MNDSALNVAVVFGGKSTEHDISVISALHVILHMDKKKYNLHSIYINKDGSVASSEETKSHIEDLFSDYAEQLFPTLNVDLAESKELILSTTYLKKHEGNFFKNLADKVYDIVFPVFHGLNGEDGTIQGLLEFMNIPYAGCGLLSSVAGIDKEVTKILCQKNDVPVVDYIKLHCYEWVENQQEIINQIKTKLELPLYIKPCRLGSSIGIVQIQSYDDIIDSINQVFQYDSKILIENAIRCPREIAVGVVGDCEEISFSSIGEFNNYKNEFFDFEAKYGPGSKKGIVPAILDESIVKQIENYSKIIFKAFEISGFARLDFFLCDDKIYFNELNTIPGMETHGTYIRMWNNKEIYTSELVDRIIDIGMKKYKRKEKIKYSLELNDYILKD